MQLAHDDNCPVCTGTYPELGHTYVIRNEAGGTE